MTPVRRIVVISLITTIAAVGLTACGSSDAEQIRATVNNWNAALEKKDAAHVCDLLGPRAEAQFTTLMSAFGGPHACVDLVKRLDPSDDEDRLTRGEVTSATVAVRGDLATLTPKGADQRIGLRRIDDDWRIDDLLHPSLRERSRGDTQLARGSDQQQIRATATAVSQALADEDFKRACQLMSYGAEAQIILAGSFASMFGTDGGGGANGQSPPSCAGAMHTIVALAEDSDDGGTFLADLPTRAQVKAATIVVRGSHATIAVPGQPPNPMVRIDGRWLVDAEVTEPLRPDDYERCWRKAGATIASGPRELRFASEHAARNIAISTGRISVKGHDWRIFYTLPESGDDPGLSTVLADPGTVAAVAYVKSASEHPRVVERARDCGE
jgi:hypothetical protein